MNINNDDALIKRIKDEYEKLEPDEFAWDDRQDVILYKILLEIVQEIQSLKDSIINEI